MSKPCYHCSNFMKNMNIKSVIYSLDESRLIEEKTKNFNLENTTISSSRRKKIFD